jgi:acyl-CoA oxidase
LRNFELIGGWGLTEDKIGSDASNLKTRADKINTTQYKLNGTKRWIGNGNRDILIIWARNSENNNVEAFIV